MNVKEMLIDRLEAGAAPLGSDIDIVQWVEEWLENDKCSGLWNPLDPCVCENADLYVCGEIESLMTCIPTVKIPAVHNGSDSWGECEGDCKYHVVSGEPLSDEVRRKMGSRSVRECIKDMGVSASTLSRFLGGHDVTQSTNLKIQRWLMGLSTSELLHHRATKKSASL